MNESVFPEYEHRAENPFKANDTYHPHNGLTKLEIFSAMAMMGLCACPDTMDTAPFANLSVRMAKALIAELEKEK